MLVKEHVIHELEDLNDLELRQVAEYVSFLKYRARLEPIPLLDENQIAALYGEFAEEDRELAEEGMADYLSGLQREDIQ